MAQDRLGLFRPYLKEVVRELKHLLGVALTSVVVFGSVARGEAREGSDIDLLVESERFKGTLPRRFKVFSEIDRRLSRSPGARIIRGRGLSTLVSPVTLTPEEVKSNPPILLDVLTDGVILYDEGNFISGHLNQLKAKLEALGARRVTLPSGKWYWDLNPDHKLGESVEI